ncbi:unnamed protein product [Ixodes pacificus]
MEFLFRIVFVAVASSHLLPVATAMFMDEVSVASSAFGAFKLASETLGGTTDGGVFIRTLNGSGCLDAGCCSFLSMSSRLRPNPHCPTWAWLKWASDGPLIVNKRPVFGGCIDCEGATLGCVAKVVSCHGRQDQQWRIKFIPGWETKYGERFFAITNFYKTNHCLTLVNGGGDGDYYTLQDCQTPKPSEWQAFYVVKNSLQRR